jgi:hypothetical protein
MRPQERHLGARDRPRPRDRLKGQPQERQHSAVRSGRDAGPTAPGERFSPILRERLSPTGRDKSSASCAVTAWLGKRSAKIPAPKARAHEGGSQSDRPSLKMTKPAMDGNCCASISRKADFSCTSPTSDYGVSFDRAIGPRERQLSPPNGLAALISNVASDGIDWIVMVPSGLWNGLVRLAPKVQYVDQVPIGRKVRVR